MEVYLEAMTQRIVQKASMQVFAACIFLACRVTGYPRTVEEIASFFRLPCGDVNGVQSVISRNLGLKIGRLYPSHLITRLLSQVCSASSLLTVLADTVTYKIEYHAMQLCELLRFRELLESTPPQRVAGVAIFIVAHLFQVSLPVEVISQVSLVPIPSMALTYAAVYRLLSTVLEDNDELLSVFNDERLSQLPKALTFKRGKKEYQKSDSTITEDKKRRNVDKNEDWARNNNVKRKYQLSREGFQKRLRIIAEDSNPYRDLFFTSNRVRTKEEYVLRYKLNFRMINN